MASFRRGDSVRGLESLRVGELSPGRFVSFGFKIDQLQNVADSERFGVLANLRFLLRRILTSELRCSWKRRLPFGRKKSPGQRVKRVFSLETIHRVAPDI